MLKMLGLCRRKRKEQNNGSVRFPSTSVTTLSLKLSSTCWIILVMENMAGVTREQGYPRSCLLRFPKIYTGRQSWDDLRADLNKAVEKQGFQFTVRKSKHTAQATVCILSCTRHRMFEDKACKQKCVNNEAQFESGMKVTTVKENCRVDQLGPTGINQPRKKNTALGKGH
jgi:hypothetical protein